MVLLPHFKIAGITATLSETIRAPFCTFTKLSVKSVGFKSGSYPLVNIWVCIYFCFRKLIDTDDLFSFSSNVHNRPESHFQILRKTSPRFYGEHFNRQSTFSFVKPFLKSKYLLKRKTKALNR